MAKGKHKDPVHSPEWEQRVKHDLSFSQNRQVQKYETNKLPVQTLLWGIAIFEYRRKPFVSFPLFVCCRCTSWTSGTVTLTRRTCGTTSKRLSPHLDMFPLLMFRTPCLNNCEFYCSIHVVKYKLTRVLFPGRGRGRWSHQGGDGDAQVDQSNWLSRHHHQHHERGGQAEALPVQWLFWIEVWAEVTATLCRFLSANHVTVFSLLRLVMLTLTLVVSSLYFPDQQMYYLYHSQNDYMTVYTRLNNCLENQQQYSFLVVTLNVESHKV